MIVREGSSSARTVAMLDMDIYTKDDSMGERMAWARKHVVWTDKDGVQRVGMTQDEIGLRLRTQGTMTGVRKVYVSQMENGHNLPSLGMLRKFAEVTGVTVGFLLMETDYPYSTKGREPTYYSPEADTAAKLVDAAPPTERARILAVIRAMTETVTPVGELKTQEESHLISDAPVKYNSFARRLIASEQIPAHSGQIRV